MIKNANQNNEHCSLKKRTYNFEEEADDKRNGVKMVFFQTVKRNDDEFDTTTIKNILQKVK